MFSDTMPCGVATSCVTSDTPTLGCARAENSRSWKRLIMLVFPLPEGTMNAILNAALSIDCHFWLAGVCGVDKKGVVAQ
jgi:hypothetical protein